jgi:hypothetical protein
MISSGGFEHSSQVRSANSVVPSKKRKAPQITQIGQIAKHEIG